MAKWLHLLYQYNRFLGHYQNVQICLFGEIFGRVGGVWNAKTSSLSYHNLMSFNDKQHLRHHCIPNLKKIFGLCKFVLGCTSNTGCLILRSCRREKATASTKANSWMRAALASHSFSTISPKKLLKQFSIITPPSSSQKFLSDIMIFLRGSFPCSKWFRSPQGAWHYITNPNFFVNKKIPPNSKKNFAASLISLPPKKKWVILWWLLYQLNNHHLPGRSQPTCQPYPHLPWLPSPCWLLPDSLPLPC